MPSPQPTLTAHAAELYIDERCLPSREDGLVGVEMEWLAYDLDDLKTTPNFDGITATLGALGTLPGGGRITYEPGGQVELSSPPCAGLTAACDSSALDAEVIRTALAAKGIQLVGIGLDPLRAGTRVLDLPRYRAMESFFDRDGPAGRRMMRSTASIQVNLDAGTDETRDNRWDFAHQLGPVLAATFANSPFAASPPSGGRSNRLATWLAIDPSRSAPAGRSGFGARQAWCEYALSARVMMIRTREDNYEVPDPWLTFALWIDHGHSSGFPTISDLDYHLTTLFPPVRALGRIELRMIDALPDPWSKVPVAIASALIDNPDARVECSEFLIPTARLWTEAASDGLTHPSLRSAALRSFEIARQCISDNPHAREIGALCDEYFERFVSKGRTPADDRLDHWSATGEMFLPCELPIVRTALP